MCCPLLQRRTKKNEKTVPPAAQSHPTGVRIRLVLPTLEVAQRYLHCTLSLRKRKGREKTKSGVRDFLLSWGTNLDLGSLTNPPWWKKGERNWRLSLGVLLGGRGEGGEAGKQGVES